MSLRDWLRKWISGRTQSLEMVKFYDSAAGRVVQIPASALQQGAMQVKLNPSGEVVWAMPAGFVPSPIKHPEFDEGTRDYIRQIQVAFAEHRPLTFEEWEDGFRRDDNPEREIAIWSHAADVYAACVNSEPDASRRREVYRCIVTAMSTGPNAIWQVFRSDVLSRSESEHVVARFFGNRTAHDAGPERDDP